jgi:hypothetical protein
VGQSSVQGQVSIRTQRPKNQLGWAQTVPSTELGTTHTALTKNTAPTNNYKGTTSAKGAGMAKSLRYQRRGFHLEAGRSRNQDHRLTSRPRNPTSGIRGLSVYPGSIHKINQPRKKER